MMQSITAGLRATFQELVLDQLGRDICTGRYRPGELLPPEPELCLRFGYSRIVIREAVKSLTAKGMLTVQRRLGTVVQAPERWHLFDPQVIAWRALQLSRDPVMVRDLAELRRIVEPAAARLAAARASVDHKSALRAAFMAMQRAVLGKGDYIQADLEFHTMILLASGNQYLRGLRASMLAMLHESFKVVTWKSGGPAASLPLHEAVCVAIEQGHPEAAEQAAYALVERAEADFEACANVAKASGGPSNP
jgi:GntR family galactonate operon transcriptional repressor